MHYILINRSAEAVPEYEVHLEDVDELLAEEATHRRPRLLLKDALDLLPDRRLVAVRVLGHFGATRSSW